jgi:phosphatidylglycerol phospholipase C
MADIDRTLTPLPPPAPEAAAALPLDTALLATPPLVATTHPSPLLEALVSPSLDAADKDSFSLAPAKFRMPECWGHRGASASFPENTCKSFIEACKAGADGIETDIHITADNVLVMFHDPELSRTTDGTGRIHDQPWAGQLE